ncbi:MAG TPA: hypothetical protein DEH78_24265 [Solibacterales bacterium]|nr:hypothetical protein [Bryobacterales bacterium]
MFKRLSLATVLLLLLFTGPALLAQSESGNAALQGLALDPSGSRISLARVTVVSEETSLRRETITDDQGRFFVPVLPVGRYRVEVSAPNFRPAVRTGLVLAVGEAVPLTVQLEVAATAEAVTVAAEAAAVDPQQSASSSSISSRSIDSLPVRGRNFVEFVQLTPGVMQESDRSGIVVAGQRSINSNVAIDGADFNDALQGNQRGGNQATFFFPQSAVREFQVVRSGASAEIGRTNAGFVNAVTKSGSNEVHGDAFYFNRNKHLTSPDAFGRKLDNRQNQFGGSIGGAIKKDKAFYFAAIEQNLLRVPFVVKFQQQAAGVVVPAELRALEGEQRGTNSPTALFLRQDTNLSDRHSLNVAYNFTRMRGENFNFDSPQQDVAATANYQYRSDSQAGKIGLVSVLTPRLINELRGQIATDYRTEQPNVVQAAIVINGFGTLGADSGRPRVFDSRRYQVSNNLSYTAGRHFLRIGTDLNVNAFNQQRESNIAGRYDFTNLANYVARNISRYRQTLSRVTAEELTFRGHGQELAFFINDKWNLTRTVTVTAGLRWEGQWNPQPTKPNPAFPQTARIPNDLSQWQPRLGISWNPGGSDKTVVRVSAGIYTARTPANLFQRVFTNNGISALAIDSRTDPAVLPLLRFPGNLEILPANLRVPVQRIFGFAGDFVNPQSGQVSASIEHTVRRDLVLSAGYLRNSTWNLQRRLDRNLFPPTINAQGMPVYPTTRPNPSIGILSINESSAHSSYDGLLLTASKRYSKRYLFQVNYTYSKTRDDDSNERNFSQEPALNVYDLTSQRAASKQDIRHNWNANGTVDLGWGFTFSGILLSRSGLPFTRVIGFDTQNDGNDDNDRAIVNGAVVPRNNGRQPAFFSTDLRLMKSIRFGDRKSLMLSAEGFNVTKHANRNFGNDGVSAWGTPAAPVATRDRPLFAPSTARYGGPRQMQLGARFVF